MPLTQQTTTIEHKLTNRKERFCYAFVNTGDKYKAFDIAKYEAKNQGAKAAAVSRLLKDALIKARIKVLEREYYEALGIDEKRILGNIAEIAFTKKGNNQDRLRALELLGKERAMWKDNQVLSTKDKPRLSESEIDIFKSLADQMLDTKLIESVVVDSKEFDNVDG